MLILVSNDDGVHSPGIHILADALRSMGDVYIIAPDRERSAASHALTLHKPLRLENFGGNIYGVNGTPTDCVNLGVNGLLQRKPDLVVSGINRGGNLGDDVTYSGTVSAAFEGTLLGIPSFAISQVAENDYKFETAARFALQLAMMIKEQSLPPGVLLNVNVPNLDVNGVKGVKITRQGKRIYDKNAVVEKVDPRGKKYYWIGGSRLSWEETEDSDFAAIEQDMISITPLRLDLTEDNAIKGLRRWEATLREKMKAGG
ncbi:MAG: 5'/3'-nucleotidase SurE [Ignavibacteriae bacterium]|nr:5'/3'-nucleotidase SurE [Ignavibacteriota bacterium]